MFHKKDNFSPRFYRAHLQHTNVSNRSFTNTELKPNQIKHKQLPSGIDFDILQDNTLKPVDYLMKHEEILLQQRHDAYPILVDAGKDQFSIRIFN